MLATRTSESEILATRTSNFRILYSNIRAIRNKLTELRLTVEKCKYDVCILTETWLNKEISDEELMIRGYTIVRKDRKSGKGGGIIVYFRSEHMMSRIGKLDDAEDTLWCSLELEGLKYLIGCVYKRPLLDFEQEKNLIDHIKHCIDHFDERGNGFNELLLVGDFNCPNIQWEMNTSNYPEDHIGSMLLELCNDNLLTQIIRDDTRFCGHSASRLDLLFVRDVYMIEEVKISAPIGKSDHAVIEVVLCRKRIMKINQKIIYDLKNANYERIKSELSLINIEEYFNDRMCLDGDYGRIMGSIKDVLENNVRHWSYSGGKVKRERWFSDECKREKKIRNDQFKKYKSDPSDLNYNNYKCKRNRYNNLLRDSKLLYERKIIKDSKTNIGILYDHIKQVNRFFPDAINNIKIDGQVLEDKLQIANEFGAVFCKGGKCDTRIIAEEDEMFKVESEVVWCTDEEVGIIIDSVSHSNAAGIDGIPNIFIKACKSFFMRLLTKVINKSMEFHWMPKEWKVGIVVPKYKKGSKSDMNNYRSITLTCCVSKVAERVILERLNRFISENEVLSCNQYGFRKGFSCEANLVDTLNDWTGLRDRGIRINVIYFDFAKAFDNVDIAILRSKLDKIGLPSYITSWIGEFLKGRNIVVKIENNLSSHFGLIKGVPQGAVLSAALFNLYVYDIEQDLTCRVKLYADDLKIYFKNENEEDIAKLQSDINRVAEWSRNNNLGINLEKCVHMVIGVDDGCHFYLDQNKIEKVTVVKDLGVWIDNRLSFTNHCNYTIKKMNSRMGILKRTFSKITPDMFKRLYLIYIQPILDYGRVTWYLPFKKDQHRLNRSVRRYTKYIAGLEDAEYTVRMNVVGILSPMQRGVRGDLIFMYKALNGLSVHNDLYQLRENKNMRGHGLIIKREQCRRNVRAEFITNRLLKIWNGLPDWVVYSDSINLFKNNLDKCLNESDYFRDLR